MNRSVRLCRCERISLCKLCVLCVSVVDEFRAKVHHRDTEDTELAQRKISEQDFCAKLLHRAKRPAPHLRWGRLSGRSLELVALEGHTLTAERLTLPMESEP